MIGKIGKGLDERGGRRDILEVGEDEWFVNVVR